MSARIPTPFPLLFKERKRKKKKEKKSTHLLHTPHSPPLYQIPPDPQLHHPQLRRCRRHPQKRAPPPPLPLPPRHLLLLPLLLLHPPLFHAPLSLLSLPIFHQFILLLPPQQIPQIPQQAPKFLLYTPQPHQIIKRRLRKNKNRIPIVALSEFGPGGLVDVHEVGRVMVDDGGC